VRGKPPLVRTYGRTHVALAVRDLDRSIEFYRGVFGSKVVLPTPVDPKRRRKT